MSTVTRLSADPDRPIAKAVSQSRYGHFTPDGREYVITDPRTPRPWVNIIANPRLGLAVSQTGSGFTWIDNSQLAVITRWEQDLARDSSGRFLYARDADSGRVWSLAPAPTWPDYGEFRCRHGLGYTTFETLFDGIRAGWTLFAHATETIEFWCVRLTNTGSESRRLDLCAFIEWCCGVAPSPRREFHKLFVETAFDSRRRAIFARNLMWDVPSADHGHWNATFPYVAALACTEPILTAQGDKSAFLGAYGDYRAPLALREDLWAPAFGRHEDAIAALRCAVELRPSQSRDIGFAMVVGESRGSTEQQIDRFVDVPRMEAAFELARKAWTDRLADQRIDTPEPTLNFLANDWLRYQAISGRIWGRCGYYQQSGAFGFRDQLQDSQVWLPIDPQHCRAQIRMHAAHQFADGSVYHWWHPLSEQGHVTRMTDDLLWLAFVTANYIRETGRLDILDDETAFIDDPAPAPVGEHVRRAFERAFQRFSPRGLPLIGAGDWNDGLSACGLQERGESIWLGHFLVGLLADWSEIFARSGHAEQSGEYFERRANLLSALNEYGWDGEWYLRATLDDGSLLGTAAARVARIFLNAQTWAILNDVAPPNRAAACLAAIRAQLVSPAGALLLAPAFDQPVPEIGYITRYAPGLRENGGVYTHAATWAIAAAAKMKDAELAGRLLKSISPANKDPDRYWAEPYVTPGNVDGPDSPHHGRGGWTWYTGSAAWLHRVIHEWLLGVRPEWDSLRLDPCLPPEWKHAQVSRTWRGCTYEIRIERAPELPRGAVAVSLDGRSLSTNALPASRTTGSRHKVQVRFA